MIVVDASAFISAVTGRNPDGDWVNRQLQNRRILSTQMMPAEVYNGIRRMELAGEVTSPDAMRARDEFSEFRLDLFPFAPFAQRVWALRSNLTSYDAWYVALAEALDCPLVTLDERLGRAAGPACTFILPPSA